MEGGGRKRVGVGVSVGKPKMRAIDAFDSTEPLYGRCSTAAEVSSKALEQGEGMVLLLCCLHLFFPPTPIH